MEEELTLQASIELLLAQVPGPVQAFVLNELSATTSALMTKHQLHVDHGGVLERELLLMLLGQSTPEEFVTALTEAGINAEVVRNIVTDVNRDIFMRLREEERKESATKTAKPVDGGASSSVPTPTVSAPVVSPRRVQPPANLPGQLPEPPAPRPVPPPPHIEVPVSPAAAAKAVEQTVPQSDQHARILHTMAKDMEALKSGADPLRVAHPAPPAWTETPSAPAPVVPPPAPVVPPQPAQTPRPVAPPAAVQAPTPHEATPQPQEALRTHLKQYGVDPYREPLE